VNVLLDTLTLLWLVSTPSDVHASASARIRPCSAKAARISLLGAPVTELYGATSSKPYLLNTAPSAEDGWLYRFCFYTTGEPRGDVGAPIMTN
jgi:hypothetical protein